MAISASQVKELRERTGAGMMECKKALTESNGDMEAAVEQMRISGLAKADKKSGNQAAEGVVSMGLGDGGKSFAMVEINSQTDFAAKASDFIDFTAAVTQAALADQVDSVDAIKVNGDTVEEARKNLVAKIGENIQVRRVLTGTTQSGLFADYSHGGRIGVVVEMEGGDDVLMKAVFLQSYWKRKRPSWWPRQPRAASLPRSLKR